MCYFQRLSVDINITKTNIISDVFNAAVGVS